MVKTRAERQRDQKLKDALAEKLRAEKLRGDDARGSSISSDSQSYPYLALARRTGEDYGDVLSWADAIDRPTNEWTVWMTRAQQILEPTTKREIFDLNQRLRVRSRGSVATNKTA